MKSYLLFQNVAGPSGVSRQSRPRKRTEKPEAKVRERRGNSNVPSYKEFLVQIQFNYVKTEKSFEQFKVSIPDQKHTKNLSKF